jgi:ubiquinone/menaquinone biosynthesis C-methylase UbiE
MRTLPFFDRFARELDERAWNADTAPWAAEAWRSVEEELGSCEGSLVVDLGTGTGAAIEVMRRFAPRARYLGVDFSEEMIARARRKFVRTGAPVEFLRCRIDALRLAPCSVGHFVSQGTFHHVKNKARVLGQLLEMLAPGGKLVNLDHFIVRGRYARELDTLRRARPTAAARNDAVRASFQWLYDEDVDHPVEFHTDPYEFAALMRRTGFQELRVHPTLQPGYAVVVGRRPET